MTAVTMATTASPVELACTAASTTSSLARKPVVKGIPAWASNSTVKAPASHGWRAARPRYWLEIVVRVPGAADHGDHGEGADDDDAVDEQVVERALDALGRAACSPSRMKPAWLIDE